jgi:transcriptional regulator GlxA family with amidase domain
MTPRTSASGPEARGDRPKLVEILLARGFVAIELALAFDSFRIANRLAGQELFRLRIVSVEAAGTLPCLGGIEIAVVPMDAVHDVADVLIVTGGAAMGRALPAVLPRLQRVRNAGGIAVVLSDAAQALLSAGAAETAAIHWEGRPVLEEAGLAERGVNSISVRSGNLVTGAGMAATADVILPLIAELASPVLMREVGRVLLLDRLRMADAEQPEGASALASLPDGPLRLALKRMETALEVPLPTAEIARCVNVSTRQLERLFARYLGKSPNVYYRDLRLHRARTLVEGSPMSLAEPPRLRCGLRRVRRVLEDEDGVSVFLANDRIRARRVILALPLRLVAGLGVSVPDAPTWMAGHAKLVATYPTAFWRETGLSGDAISHRGPLAEIHDASPDGARVGALFGFAHIGAARQPGFRDAAVAQLARLFGQEAATPDDVFIKDWSMDPATATEADLTPPSDHPNYSAVPPARRVIFAGTEMSPDNGGFLEGALAAAEAAHAALAVGEY